MSQWLVCGSRRPDAPSRVYCFPHGGGPATEFVGWSALTERLEIHGVQLPGRGTRLREPGIGDLDTLVRRIVAEVVFEPPFGLYGHSFGGLLAFEVARGLRRAGKPLPRWLWVSAHPSPDLPRTEPPIHRLPDECLLRTVQQRHGGLPERVFTDPELAGLVLPALRADHAAVETYRYRPGEPLPCDLSVHGGRGDTVAETALRSWRAHATGRFVLRLYAGDHFFPHRRRQTIVRDLEGDTAAT